MEDRRCHKKAMSKRKLDDDAGNNYSILKIAKITAEDNSMVACLQLITEDIAYIIVNFLKLSATSLSALSLTCSRWHNQIDTILTNYLKHYLPISYKECSRQRRNEAIEIFTLLRSKMSLDLQLFEFPATELLPKTSFHISHINAIPWAPHIAFVRTHGGYVIIDLKKRQFVVQERAPRMPNLMGNGLCRLCSVNEKRKQVVISSTVKNERYRHNNLPKYYEWLNVYNVDDNGTVELVTKFCVKNDYAEYDYAWDSYAPLNIYLDSNGIIWHSRLNELKRFSIDKNEEIETDFDLNNLYVIGIGEIDNNVVLFCYDYKERSVPISIFDTSLKRFTSSLPESESVMLDHDAQMRRLKATVRNNLLLITTEDSCDLNIGIYSVKQFKQIYTHRANDYGIVSPTGNKVAKFLGDSSRVEIYLREGDQFNLIESHISNTRYDNFWIGDDTLLQISGTFFTILDNKSSTFYHLPFKKRGVCPAVAVVGKTVFIVDLVGKNPKHLSLYQMKIL